MDRVARRGTGVPVRRYHPAGREREGEAVTRDDIEALVARERPGWRVLDVVEINDESGPSWEVAVEQGDERRTLLLAEDKQIVGERRR